MHKEGLMNELKKKIFVVVCGGGRGWGESQDGKTEAIYIAFCERYLHLLLIICQTLENM